LRCADRSQNIGAAAGAGIGQPTRAKLCQGGTIGLHPLRLPQNGQGPLKPQPMQIVIDLRLPCEARAALVNVFDAQKKRTTCGLGHLPRQQRRIGMAQMQRSRGRRGKAGDHHALATPQDIDLGAHLFGRQMGPVFLKKQLRHRTRGRHRVQIGRVRERGVVIAQRQQPAGGKAAQQHP